MTQGYYILHEGLLGILGEQGLKEEKYDSLEKEAALSATEKGKTLPAGHRRLGRHHRQVLGRRADPRPEGALHGDASRPRRRPTASTTTRRLRDAAAADRRSPAPPRPRRRACSPAPRRSTSSTATRTRSASSSFELLIDWGWFCFITKPLFKLLDGIYKLVGNFGVAILIVTVIVKAVFFPLANKSYSSMAKMKALQPQMAALRERYPDDKVKQQQELMELYKREKINPVAGCLPVVIQIPVFFALYKVLFVTIEMRHAPFFGWIQDLSAPDPTSIFNLFGLIPWTPAARS